MSEQVREEPRPARLVVRRWRGIAIAVVIVVTGAMAIVELHRPAGTDSRYNVVEQATAEAVGPPDPLMAELIRCRALPPQIDDATCRAAWDENRRRFFGESRATRVPGDPMPAYAPIPAAGPASAMTER